MKFVTFILMQFVQFIYRRDLACCPIFGKLKTLLLNEWCAAVDLGALVCILQHSPILEKLTLQLHKDKVFVPCIYNVDLLLNVLCILISLKYFVTSSNTTSTQMGLNETMVWQNHLHVLTLKWLSLNILANGMKRSMRGFVKFWRSWVHAAYVLSNLPSSPQDRNIVVS